MSKSEGLSPGCLCWPSKRFPENQQLGGKLTWTLNGSILVKLFVACNCKVLSVHELPALSVSSFTPFGCPLFLLCGCLHAGACESFSVGAVAVFKGGGVCAS